MNKILTKFVGLPKISGYSVGFNAFVFCIVFCPYPAYSRTLNVINDLSPFIDPRRKATQLRHRPGNVGLHKSRRYNLITQCQQQRWAVPRRTYIPIIPYDRRMSAIALRAIENKKSKTFTYCDTCQSESLVVKFRVTKVGI